MGDAVVPWLEWRNAAYTVVPIGVLVASMVFTFKLVCSRTKQSPGPKLGRADCRKSTRNTMATSSNDIESPEGVKQLNDSLYQLFAPRGVPEIDIIFFHGLQAGDYRNAYWKTWTMASDGKTLWPQTFLGKQFPNARMLSVSYDSAVAQTSTSGLGDLYLIGENLVEDIILSDPQSGNRPILLVGHSLGGLLLKYFVTESAPRVRKNLDPNVPSEARKIATIDNFLANVWEIFYYSTPHTGTELADIASKIPGRSEVLIFLKTLSKESARLNNDFAKWRKMKGVRATSLAEGLPTDPNLIWGVKGMEPTKIVVEASCRFDTDELYTVSNANHITICQPNKEFQSSYSKLQQVVQQCLEKSLDERFNKLKPLGQQVSTTGSRIRV